ncbi:MAG: hypothetical protein DHS80DRAFT_33535 [Piptocephalis tieghemiana]|nr:MAG: hypothetical protein DHS80DRAFT_33535 [Piptocephalis tieghemiana]
MSSSLSSESDSVQERSSDLEYNDISLLDDLLNGRTRAPLTVRHYRAFLRSRDLDTTALDFCVWCVNYRRRFKALSRTEQSKSRPMDELPPQCLSPKSPDAQIPPMTSSSPLPPSPPPVYDLATGSDHSARRDDRYRLSLASRLTADQDEEKAVESEKPIREWLQFGSKAPYIQPWDRQEEQRRQGEPLVDLPFARECQRVVETCVNTTQGSLLLPLSARDTLVEDLRSTTHPSVFEEVESDYRVYLLSSTFRAFHRESAENINRMGRASRVAGGFLFILTAIIIDALLISRHPDRWLRLATLPALFTGILLIVQGASGVCIILTSFDIANADSHKKWDKQGAPPQAYTCLLSEKSGKVICSNMLSKNPRDSLDLQPQCGTDCSSISSTSERYMKIDEPIIKRMQRTIILRAVLSTALLSVIYYVTILSFPIFASLNEEG